MRWGWRVLLGFPMVVRYLIAGGSSAAANLAVLYVGTDILGFWYLYSSIAAFCFGVGVSFTMQKFVTFQNTELAQVHRQAIAYLLLTIGNLFVNTGFMYALVEWGGLWHITAQIVSALIISVESFIIYRLVIFKR
jgi:putative flippase GtrA